MAPAPNASWTAKPLAGADAKQPRLMDQLRQQIRYLHYSRRIEQAYVHWVRAFIRYHCPQEGPA